MSIVGVIIFLLFALGLAWVMFLAAKQQANLTIRPRSFEEQQALDAEISDMEREIAAIYQIDRKARTLNQENYP